MQKSIFHGTQVNMILKVWKQPQKFSSWISIIPDEQNLQAVQNFFFIKNAFDFENLIFTLYCTACVCNKASIIEPTSNDFLACWKFITLRKLTQLSLLFKVIKHLEYTFWANPYSLMFCLSRFKSICGNQSPNY